MEYLVTMTVQTIPLRQHPSDPAINTD